MVTAPATRQGPCSASKEGCWPERAADITARTSPPRSDGAFEGESGYPDRKAVADVSLGQSHCHVEGSFSKMRSLLEGKVP